MKGHMYRAAGFCIAVQFLFVSVTVAHAGDLYTLTGTATSTGQTVTATGSNFLDLLQNASTASNQFQALKGQDATYTLNYAGQTDVIKMTRNASGTTATITIPSTGQSKTFTGATDSDVRKEIADYLRKNTDDAIGKLNKKLTELSKVSFIDGNPNAITAVLADDAFHRFAIPDQGAISESGWWIKGGANTYHSNGLSGNTGNVAFGFDVPFGRSAALSIGLVNEYNSLENANSFSFLGVDVGVPITVYRTPLLDGFVWKLTPFGQGVVTISPDTLSGGGIYGGGAASSLSYITGPWTFTLGDQINYLTGINLGIGGRVYGTHNLDQWITKNGFDITLMPGQHLFLDGGLVWTHFFKNVGVEDYLSPTVGIGWQISDSSRIRVGARSDLANGYTGVGGEISLTVSY